MSTIKLTTKEEFNAAVKYLQVAEEDGPPRTSLAEYLRRITKDAIQEYANEHNICLFVGGVLAEKRPEVEQEKITPERTDRRKVYIAGPMSGLPDFNRKAFNDMADLLRSRGHIVLNPAILPGGMEQREYMDICIAMLRCADSVCLLEGWSESAGANAEVYLAKKLKLEILPEHVWRVRV